MKMDALILNWDALTKLTWRVLGLKLWRTRRVMRVMLTSYMIDKSCAVFKTGNNNPLWSLDLSFVSPISLIIFYKERNQWQWRTSKRPRVWCSFYSISIIYWSIRASLKRRHMSVDKTGLTRPGAKFRTLKKKRKYYLWWGFVALVFDTRTQFISAKFCVHLQIRIILQDIWGHITAHKNRALARGF